MKITVRYSYVKARFKINIKHGIIIYKDLFILRLKRLKRWLIFQLQLIKPTIFVLIISFLYMGIVYLIGLKTNQYTNFCETIWDFKTFLLSTIVLVALISFTKINSQKSKNLAIQYNYYLEIMSLCDIIMETLYKLISKDKSEMQSIFFTDEHNKYFIEKIETINIKKASERIKLKMDNQLIWYFLTLNDEMQRIDKSSIVVDINSKTGFKKDFNNQFYELKRKIYIFQQKNGNSLGKKEYIQLLLDLNNEMYYFIYYLRLPWRWDFYIDMKIRKILNSYGEINEDDYNPLDIWFVNKNH